MVDHKPQTLLHHIPGFVSVFEGADGFGSERQRRKLSQAVPPGNMKSRNGLNFRKTPSLPVDLPGKMEGILGGYRIRRRYKWNKQEHEKKSIGVPGYSKSNYICSILF